MNVASESVDVIIPVYNSANFIEKAIESVMAQKNVIIGKLIVVNDGSRDETEAVIRAMNLPNLELITTPNRGVSLRETQALPLQILNGLHFWMRMIAGIVIN